MDLHLSELQVELSNSLDRFLSQECTIQRVRAAEASGFDRPMWDGIVDMGAHCIGLPSSHGGFDASLLDVAVCSELYGKYLAPVPVIESVVVGRLLAACATASALAMLRALVEEGKVIALALSPLTTSRRQLVRTASLTRTIVALEGDQIVAFISKKPIERVQNMARDASGLVDFDGPFDREVLDGSAQAKARFAQAITEWKALSASMLSGLGEQALRIGADYTKEREAFGRPIGSFQAVAHRLADAATAIEGAKLISRAAAAAAVESPERFATLASMAFIWSSLSSQRSAEDALHVHGGYGFTLEYDIQLYVRRAKAWPLGLHDVRAEYQQVASDLFDKPDRMKQWIFS